MPHLPHLKKHTDFRQKANYLKNLSTRFGIFGTEPMLSKKKLERKVEVCGAG